MSECSEKDSDNASDKGTLEEMLPLVEHGSSELDARQHQLVLEHTDRLEKYRRATDVLDSLGGTVSAGMRNTISRTMKWERKKFKRHDGAAAAVAASMEELVHAEELAMMNCREQQRDIKRMEREKQKARMDLKKVQEQVRQEKKKQRALEEAARSYEAFRKYSVAALGGQKKGGGGKPYQRVRLEAMERVKTHALLTMQQGWEWPYWKVQWDSIMADCHGTEWGKLFGQIMMRLLERLKDGESTALSDFMRDETERVMSDIQVLEVPPSCIATDHSTGASGSS